MPAAHTVIQILDYVPAAGRSFDLFLLRLANKLLERQIRTVHVFAGEPDESFARTLEKANLNYHVARFQPTMSDAVRLGRTLRRYRPHIIQSTFMSKFSPALPILKLVTGAPYLILADHSSGKINVRSAATEAIAALRGKVMGSYVDRIIAVSEFVRCRNVTGNHLPGRKVRLIPNGVDTEKYKPIPNPSNAGLIVAFAGQLIPEKGVLTLLKAVNLLARADVPPFQLVIAGEGAQSADLRSFTKRQGLSTRVRFVGQIDWVDKLFAEADVVAVPSEWEESFGLVVAEAMACGVAVIASDAGAIPEIIGPSGQAGVIFPKGDFQSLATILAGVLNDCVSRRRMGRAARDRVEICYTIQHMVDGYVGVYEELLAG